MNNQEMINQWYMQQQQIQQNAADTILYSCLENTCCTVPITNNDVLVILGILISLLILAMILYSVTQD